MFGQGSPHLNSVSALCWMSHRMCNFKQPLRWLMVLCALSTVSLARAQTTDLQLRVAWGGGTARMWQGTLKVQDGSFADLQYLGLDADESATIYIDRDAVLVRQLAERDYDGFDVRVQAATTSALKFELAPQKHPEETRRIEVPLADLISGFYHTELDAEGNQLLIQRVSGDTLRVTSTAAHWCSLPVRRSTSRSNPISWASKRERRCATTFSWSRLAADETLWEQDLESTITDGRFVGRRGTDQPDDSQCGRGL